MSGILNTEAAREAVAAAAGLAMAVWAVRGVYRRCCGAAGEVFTALPEQSDHAAAARSAGGPAGDGAEAEAGGAGRRGRRGRAVGGNIELAQVAPLAAGVDDDEVAVDFSVVASPLTLPRPPRPVVALQAAQKAAEARV